MKKGVLLHNHRSLRMMFVFIFVFSFLLNGYFAQPAAAYYQYISGVLMDGGTPVTTAIDMRFSLWGVADVRSGDVDSNGAINTSSPHYGGFQAVHSFTPGQNGIFNIFSSDISGFPEHPGPNAYLLQVEWKYDLAADNTYQVFQIDAGPMWATTDRYLLGDRTAYSVPDAGPRTYSDTFTLDTDSDASTAVTLVFGESLAKTLKFHLSNSRFELNDDLAITGGLSATGAVDFSGASSFKNVVVSSDPGTCSPGQQFYNSTSNKLKVCTASNTWVPVDTDTDVGTLYINRITSSGMYATVGEFIYSGTSVEGAITAFYATLSIDSGAISYDARIYDLTNGQVIAEMLGQTNNTQQIKDYGTVSNLPSGQAHFQIQLRRYGGTTQLVRLGSLQYRH